MDVQTMSSILPDVDLGRFISIADTEYLRSTALFTVFLATFKKISAP